jgi:hypothetical protein
MEGHIEQLIVGELIGRKTIVASDHALSKQNLTVNRFLIIPG